MKIIFVSSIVLVMFAVSANTEDIYSQGTRAVLRVYEECNKAELGFTPCLKKKAITFIDRVARMDALVINDGFKVIRNDNAPALDKPMNENELEQTLPRGLEARNDALTDLLMDRVSSFFNARTIQIAMPNVSSEELGRGLEEGRGKMKKMMSMMMMGFMMKMAAMVPVAIAGLYLLAGKALIVSKIALLLAGIIGLKKLLASKQSGGSGQSQGWSQGGGGGGGGSGWERSLNEAQNIAYHAHTKQ